MKFLKQNFLMIIAIVLLVICILKINDLQVKYQDLSERYFMLNTSVNAIPKNTGYKQETPAVKEIMTLTELAEYLRIDLAQAVEMARKDNTIPYVVVDNQYHFSKTAIDKWMENQRKIETK